MADVQMSDNSGLLPVVSNEKLMEQEAAERKKRVELEQSSEPITSLAGYIRKCWDDAVDAKRDIETRLIRCKDQREGQYDSDDMAAIEDIGGSDIFMQLTDIKCAAGESWTDDILFPPGEKPWSLDPTPVAELPDDVEGLIQQTVQLEAMRQIMAYGMTMNEITPDLIKQQLDKARDRARREIQKEAKESVKRLEDEIDDDFVQGGWYKALADIVYDFYTYPVCYMRGPVIRNRKCLYWDKSTGMPVAQVEETLKREYYRVSPFNVFPSRGARHLNDGYVFEFHQLSRRDLRALKGLPGYNDDTIQQILDDHGDSGYREEARTPGMELGAAEISNIETEYEDEHDHGEFEDNPEGMMDALEFMGPVPGKHLIEWGFEEEVPDPDDDYEVTAWIIGKRVFGVKFNEHPLGERNIFSTSFRKRPGSIVGRALPEVVRDIQRMCNATARAWSNRMGISSLPMVEINTQRLAAGQDVTGPHAGMVIQTINDLSGGNSPAVRFQEIESRIDEFRQTYDYFFKQMSEVSGIPAYVYGSSDIGGAARTASGLSMLMNSASKGLKSGIRNIDAGIIIKTVAAHYEHLLLFEPERIEYLGDIKVRPRASEYLVMLEQLQLRRNEFLQITANPFDMQIIGQKGRAALLRERARDLHMPVDIVPEDFEMELAQEQQKMMAFVQAVSQAFNIPPEQVIMAIQGQPGDQNPNNSQNPAQSPETAMDGSQAAGRDVGLFNQGGIAQ